MLSVRPLFRASRAHIWPVWTGSDSAFPRLPDGISGGSVHRQDRLAGAGGVGQAVEAYPSRSQLSNRKLGAFAVGDSSMAPRLMAGGSIRLDKADQLLCDMGQAPIGPGFVSEVEAFQSDTGIGDSKFGSDAAGDPLFLRKLRSGASPLLSTVEQVQAWMRANRSAFEPEPGAQAKEYGEQSLPDVSSDGVTAHSSLVSVGG